MIARLVVGVVLAATLLAVSTPALSAARADAADATVQRQLSGLGDRLRAMVAADEPTAGPGARRVATVRLPGRSATSARVAGLRFETRNGSGVASWRVGDDGSGHTRLVGIPIRPPPGGLTLDTPGTHRLVFALDFRDDRRFVAVRRLRGRSPRAGGTDA